MIGLCVKRWLRRNGTSRVPYERITTPERDEPRDSDTISDKMKRDNSQEKRNE